MPDYHHLFENVEDYLHHRLPYLMVQKIISIDDSAIVTHTKVSKDAFFLNGHFPGAPTVPGAMMQELATQSAGILIAARFNPMKKFDTHDPFANEYALGVLVRVKNARYRHFARHGDKLVCRVELTDRINDLFSFLASVSAHDQQLMRIEFQLTNIKSAVLTGEPSPVSTLAVSQTE